jgi:mycothiol synthase
MLTIAPYTVRAFRGETDVPALLDVLQADKVADGHEDLTTLAQMLNFYRHLTNCDPERDMLLVEGPAGLVAYCRATWVKEHAAPVYRYPLVVHVRPEARGQGLGRALLAWLETRALAIAAEQNHPRPPEATNAWEAESTDRQPAKTALLQRAGYAPVRYFYEMVRPDLENIPDRRLPPGLVVRPALPEHYAAIWQASNEAFQDHWGSSEQSAEDYERWLNSDLDSQREIWKVAWDTATNQVAGMVLGYIVAEDNARNGRLRGWTENICVRRPWRRQGLASALIAENLRELKARGMTEAALGVDTESLTGALRVYEAMGFRPVHRGALYLKPFPN